MATFDEVHARLDHAVERIFGGDPRVQAVGITCNDGDFQFSAVRSLARIVPQGAFPAPSDIDGVPIVWTDAPDDAKPLLEVPAFEAVEPASAGVPPEQRRYDPVGCGLQVSNWDADDRDGVHARQRLRVGTLGVFVTLADGRTAILSNNHVLANENQGLREKDRIVQPGALGFADHVATLTDFVALQPSPTGTSLPNQVWNEVDAAVAVLAPRVQSRAEYVTGHKVPAPCGTAPARSGERVFKVGRTTGLTYGVVEDVAAVLYVGYRCGTVWFRNSFRVVATAPTAGPFSLGGDSGSAVVRESTGEVLGLLYAGDSKNTYVCPIGPVLKAFSCSL